MSSRICDITHDNSVDSRIEILSCMFLACFHKRKHEKSNYTKENGFLLLSNKETRCKGKGKERTTRRASEEFHYLK
jgi:hypothetical protein